jgi:protein gp37
VVLVHEKLEEPLHWKKPCRVFVNSMSDLFHESLLWSQIERVFETIQEASQHTFQVLTKRPEHAKSFLEWWSLHHDGPPANLWLGVSVEDQKTADERIPLLLQTPAAVRFVSYEPALGPVDFSRYLTREGKCCGVQGCEYCDGWGTCELVALDWLIVGGESGPGARPCNVAWSRSVVGQCADAGVPCFVKQLGERPEWETGTEREKTLRMDPILLKSRKGGDPSEWPEDLRVREFPR